MIPEISTFNCGSKLTRKFIIKNFPDFWEIIKNNPGRSVAEKLYMYYNGIPDIPICPVCGEKLLQFRGIAKGYSQYCCNHCSVMDPKRKAKAKNTMMQRYGVEYASQSKAISSRIRQTNLERYGGTGFASKKLMDKTKHTNLEKYGVEWAGQSDIFKSKRETTNRKKYGSSCPLQNSEVAEKSRTTTRERYGVDYAMQNPGILAKSKTTLLERYGGMGLGSQVIREKVQQTNLNKYGVDNATKSPDIMNKVINTNRERYGVDYVMQDPDIAHKNKVSKLNTLIFQHDFLVGITNTGLWQCVCPHDKTFRDAHDICTDCPGYYEISSINYYGRKEFGYESCTNILPIQSKNRNTFIEQFIKDILNEVGITYETNNRSILSGKELDIYIPSKNMAIECNGIYWHSTASPCYKGSKTHFNKWKSCKDIGIQLLTIWEDEIISKPEIIKSIILAKLGIYTKSIGARECVVCRITSKDTSDFLQENHIQGSHRGGISYGLYYNDKLVAVMLFDKRSRLSGSGNYTQNEYELVRFCSKLGWHIQGAAQRLLVHFINDIRPEKIISFSSHDISNGNLYKLLGFTESGDTIPYWYIDSKTKTRYHRSLFSKIRLIQQNLVPEEFNGKNWTEFEVTSYMGLMRIYTSGVTKWELNINNQEN